MKKHTPFGKVIFWLGFLLFILGSAFNETLGIITNAPESFYSFSISAIIIGIILLIISNVFIKEKD
ncbi:hypothetical protein SAMN04487943_101647 [Gracilibacillus orientalis]|uniref:Uncharacterized protein n=1 Tax=Gracilibacillus orientalis TaxID=334253 RepID=A0A1I4HU53_9BACI|nr:hypothetical protein [Gracilibacillus orientalis]SFL45672.1 hypothetical protein SAMN04487943_101647 [Gracilibacillus orientalis]